MSFVICIRDKVSAEINLWRLDGVTAQAVTNYEIIGCGEPLYKFEADKLIRGKINATQAAMIGLHLLSIGRATTYYIDRPFQVLTVHRNGVLVESEQRVRLLEEKVQEVDETHYDLLMNAYDSASTPESLDRRLQLFEDRVRELQIQAQSVADSLLVHGTQAVEPQFHELVTQVHRTVKTMLAFAKLNRAFYQSDFYGQAGSPDAIALRRKVAGAIHKANEQIVKVIEFTRAMNFTEKPREWGSFMAIVSTISETTSPVIDSVEMAYVEKQITLEQKDRLADLLKKIAEGGKRAINLLSELEAQKADTLSTEHVKQVRELFETEVLAPYLEFEHELQGLPDDVVVDIKLAVKTAQASLLLLGNL